MPHLHQPSYTEQKPMEFARSKRRNRARNNLRGRRRDSSRRRRRAAHRLHFNENDVPANRHISHKCVTTVAGKRNIRTFRRALRVCIIHQLCRSRAISRFAVRTYILFNAMRADPSCANINAIQRERAAVNAGNAFFISPLLIEALKLARLVSFSFAPTARIRGKLAKSKQASKREQKPANNLVS